MLKMLSNFAYLVPGA